MKYFHAEYVQTAVPDSWNLQRNALLCERIFLKNILQWGTSCKMNR